MSRPNPFVLTGIFLVFIAVFGGLPFLKGGLYLDSHEGDIYHLLDIIFRMQDGQVPHLDFVTPLGILAFLPIVALLKAGLSFGTAFITAQLLVSLVLLPVLVYVTSSRLPKRQAILFGCVTLGLVLTMTYLHASSGVTAAMHYNRWAWAFAFVALLLAFVPGDTERPRLDGVLIGLLATALLMTKMTFFVALVPAITAALFVRGQRMSVVFALATGGVLTAISTLFLGVTFWTAYLGDLLTVMGSQVRPNVGLPLSDLLSGPQYLVITLTGIAAAFFIRRSGYDAMALVIIALLFPGFIFITYQNFGNDPTWLLFIAFLVLAYRPERGFADVGGIDVRGALNAVSLVAVVVNFPSVYTSAMAPIEHAAFDKSRFMPFVDNPEHPDFFVRTDRAHLLTASIALDDSPGVWEKYRKDVRPLDIPEVLGVRFPMCELGAGSRALMTEVVAQLKADGIPSGSQFFTTGLLSAFWLYGDFEPLENGAPWYYGGLSGLENADYVLIPKCVYVNRVRGIMIDDLLRSDVPLSLVSDNALYALFSLN